MFWGFGGFGVLMGGESRGGGSAEGWVRGGGGGMGRKGMEGEGEGGVDSGY